MRVFELTRIRLTVWYVLIIMTISTMFSFVIYNGVSRNIEASFKNAESRLERSFNQRMAMHQLIVKELENSKYNVFVYLLATNLIILALSTLISYSMAGKTLLPIEELIQEQKRFVADASHELKTPLTSLKTSIEVSLRSGKLPKDIHKLFQYNLEDVNVLNKLIDKLLGLATVENKQLFFDNLDIKEVIRTATKRVRYLLDKKQVKIKVNTKNYQLIGDSTSLTELFVILFDNAIKYNLEGGEVGVDVTKSKNHLTIEVKDTGIGINKKYLSKVFDRFYRVSSSRTSSTESGFGLGLSVAKKIVENHRGSIAVSSEITKGTTFTIKLPLKS